MKQAAKTVLATLGVATIFALFAFVQVWVTEPLTPESVPQKEAPGRVAEETAYIGSDRHRRLEAGLLLSSTR